MSLRCLDVPTAIGPLKLAADDTGLRHVLFPVNRHPPRGHEHWRPGTSAILHAAREQLLAYFAGTRRAFDLPLAPVGTAFQRRVWTALARIPYGATCSYRDIAHAIGEPQAVRAVGAANGRNPLPVIVPCHRVIGADGSLTGFGGGLPCKQWLLRHESAVPEQLLLT